MENKWKYKMEKSKEKVVEKLNLPTDLLLGASNMICLGNKQVTIENYKGILKYSTEIILVQGKTCQIEIQGKRLAIEYYTNEEMKITGRILQITYI